MVDIFMSRTFLAQFDLVVCLFACLSYIFLYVFWCVFVLVIVISDDSSLDDFWSKKTPTPLNTDFIWHVLLYVTWQIVPCGMQCNKAGTKGWRMCCLCCAGRVRKIWAEIISHGLRLFTKRNSVEKWKLVSRAVIFLQCYSCQSTSSRIWGDGGERGDRGHTGDRGESWDRGDRETGEIGRQGTPVTQGKRGTQGWLGQQFWDKRLSQTWLRSVTVKSFEKVLKAGLSGLTET